MRVIVVDRIGAARAVEASRDLNQDLFWGLRGCGHLFGVVVEATFRAQPWHHDTWHSSLVFSPMDAGLVADALDQVHCEGGMQGRLVFFAPNQQVSKAMVPAKKIKSGLLTLIYSAGCASPTVVRWTTRGGRHQVRDLAGPPKYEGAPHALRRPSNSVP